MLLCGPFAIEGFESRHLELGRALDCVPLYWVGSSGSRLLSGGGGFEGSDLIFKSLHPVTCVTISSLTLRLYFSLVISLGLRLDFIIMLCGEWKRMELSESEL